MEASMELHSKDPNISSSQLSTGTGTQPQEPLQYFSGILKAFYSNSALFLDPNIGKVDFINLALVKKQNINEEDKLKDKFLRDSLHGLEDDIMRKKKRINSHKDIFNYGTKSARKLVLVEGSPGVGKTMLAKKLCRDWANGTILAEYEIVLLIELRRFQSEKSLSIENLVDIYCGTPTLSKEIAHVIVKNGGEKVLLIFEGWDELHPLFRQEMSFFFDLITANKLPKASVLVTSRPTVTDTIAIYMEDRHIEVLGFQPDQIKMYVEQNFSQDASIIMNHLEKFPNLHALAHIPLTLSIICKVVEDEHILPSTLTELYDRFIYKILFKSLKRNQSSLIGMNSISELPKDMQAEVKKLCETALGGLKVKKYVFNPNELFQQASKDGHGLLTVFPAQAKAGHSHFYQFIHLSVQEFLAALQINELSGDARIALLEEHREDKQFHNVWKFLAGITKLRDKDFQECILQNTKRSNKSQLFLVHCLYEAHDREICQLAAIRLNWTLNLSNMSLNTTDCLCAAYAMTNAYGQWIVDLRNCNIGAEGLKVFKQQMLAQLNERSDQVFSIKELNIHHNQITSTATHHLAEILQHNVEIAILQLASNKFGNEGVQIICNALSRNETITSINFSQCGLTSESGTTIAEMLERNKSLMELFIRHQPLKDSGVIPIVRALTVNKTITEICFTETGLTTKSVLELQVALAKNKVLKVLRLERNNLTSSDCDIIAKIISTNHSLTLIDLSKNFIRDAGFEKLLDALIAYPNNTLQKLGCLGCKLTCDGLKKLVHFFQVTEVFKGIQLGCNDLGDKGAEYIGEAIVVNKSQSVVQILLENTGMSRAARDELERVRQSLNRPANKKLDISYLPYAQVMRQQST